MTIHYGLLGQNIAYSLSPKIHNAALEYFGIIDQYKLFDISPHQDPQKFLDDFFAQGGLGLNVTKPYKGLAAQWFSTPQRSVNVLYKSGDSIQGASTDGLGFFNSLKRFGFEDFEAVLFLGFGGAAQAVFDFGQTVEPKKSHRWITLVRSPQKIPKNDSLEVFELTPQNLKRILTGKTLLIQATSAPTDGLSFKHLLENLPPFEGFVYDMVYGFPSEWCDWAKKNSIPTCDGLPMLIEQARLSQELWWGKSMDYETIFKIVAAPSGRQSQR